MAEKPKPTREVVVSRVNEREGIIEVSASNDALEDLASFGAITYDTGIFQGLQVDPRYDFTAVLEYMQNYG